MNFKKFNPIFFLFLISKFHFSTDNQVPSPSDFRDMIQQGFKENQKSLFHLFIKTIVKAATDQIASKLLSAILEYFQDIREHNSTKVNVEDLDSSVVELIYPLDVKIAFNNFLKNALRALRANKPPFHLLVSGPAGTGKTTGMTRVAKAIKKEFPGAKIYFFEGGKIFAKGPIEAVNTLSKNIEHWKEESKNNVVIIILDEAEVLFPNRDLLGNSDKNDLVTLFLSFTGNLKPNTIIMVSTNHPESMDPAIRRRFPVLIHVRSPTEAQIMKMIQSYIVYYNEQSEYDITPVLNLENNIEKLLNMAQYLMGMSGADVDNLVKKAIDSAKSDLGFLSWWDLYKSMRDEIIKKATFSKKINEEKKEEIKRILLLDKVYNIFDYNNSYNILTSVNINYEKFITNGFNNVLYALNYLDNLNIFLDIWSNQSISNKAVPLSNISFIHGLKNQTSMIHKFFSGSPNIKPNFSEKYCDKVSSCVISIDQNLSPEVPKTGDSLDKLDKSTKNANLSFNSSFKKGSSNKPKVLKPNKKISVN
jgi:AAA+ superfamily predicted ATPase